MWSHPDKSSWIPQDTSTLDSPPFVQIRQSLHNQGFAFSDWVWVYGMSLCVSVCSYRLWHLHQLKILSESNTITAYICIYIFFLICISIVIWGMETLNAVCFLNIGEVSHIWKQTVCFMPAVDPTYSVDYQRGTNTLAHCCSNWPFAKSQQAKPLIWYCN